MLVASSDIWILAYAQACAASEDYVCVHGLTAGGSVLMSMSRAPTKGHVDVCGLWSWLLLGLCCYQGPY